MQKEDRAFIEEALKYFALPRNVIKDITYEETGASYPDIWITDPKQGPVTLTVTQEWKKQTEIERHKRLTHEILHITGMDHWDSPITLDGGHTLLYSTIPQKDTFSWMVYYNIVNDIKPITSPGAFAMPRLQRCVIALLAIIYLFWVSY